MNLVVLSGNLARDPETRVLPSGTTVVNFTVATSRYFKKKDGQRDKETTFIQCEAWDTAAQYIGENFIKGDYISLTGSIKQESWEVDGQKRSRLKIRAGNFERGQNPRRSKNGEAKPSEASSAETPF